MDRGMTGAFYEVWFSEDELARYREVMSNPRAAKQATHKFPDSVRWLIVKMRDSGERPADIRRVLGVSKGTVDLALRVARAAPQETLPGPPTYHAHNWLASREVEE